MRWGSLEELAGVSGMTARNLIYIRQREPDVLVFRTVGRKTEYEFSKCNQNLRKRERERAMKQAEAKFSSGAEARLEVARATKAEIEVAQLQERLIPVDQAAKEVEAMLGHLRAQLLAIPHEFASELVGCRTIAQATSKLDTAIREAMTALSENGKT